MAHPLSSRLAVMGAAALFSTGGAAIKFCSLSGWQVACLRSGVAAAALALLLPGARRGWDRLTWLAGCAYAATLISFVLANKLTTAASAIFLQSTAPLYLLLLAPLLLGETIRRADLLFMAALAAGMALFFAGGAGPALATAPNPAAGNLIALGSGLFYALLLTGMRLAARGEPRSGAGGSGAGAGRGQAVALAGNLIASAACLPFALPMPRPAAADLATLIYLGIFQIALAYALLTFGMREVGALQTSLLLLVEPVLNPVWAWLVQGERPGAWALAGGAVIIAATAMSTWRDAAAGAPPAPARGADV